uniref:Uncharacterized protein n=1 Tax=Anopheles coluzzii TaxID=1518534 RepID=A0A8W7P2P9_ANOCL
LFCSVIVRSFIVGWLFFLLLFRTFHLLSLVRFHRCRHRWVSVLLPLPVLSRRQQLQIRACHFVLGEDEIEHLLPALLHARLGHDLLALLHLARHPFQHLLEGRFVAVVALKVPPRFQHQHARLLLRQTLQTLVGPLVDASCQWDVQAFLLVLGAYLKLGVRYPHLHVDGALQQPFVQLARQLELALLHLEVDVAFPQQLGHVEAGLLDRQLVDGARPIRITEQRLQLGKLHPRGAVLRSKLEELFVQNAAPVELAQLYLEIDVPPKEFVPRAASDRHAERLARGLQVFAANFELRVQQPDFAERKQLVRYQLEAGAVDLSRALEILRFQLLVQCVVNPQVDVPAPQILVLRRRNVRDRPLVRFAYQLRIVLVLHQAQIVEPGVVVGWIFVHLLLVLELALRHDHILDARPVAVLFLVYRVRLVQFRRAILRQVVQRVLVDDAHAVVLLLALLEASERDEQPLVGVIVAEELDRPLVHSARPIDEPVRLLEPGVLDPVLHLRMYHHEPLVDRAGPVDLFVAQLEVDVRLPRLLLRLPFHPALKHLPGAGNILQHFFHVRVLVPELVDTRQYRDRPVPQIARMVHLPVLHLHLRVLQPYRNVPMVVIDRTLPDRPGALNFLLRLFPLRVLDPVADDHAVFAQIVLERFALPLLVVGQLGRIGNLLLRRRWQNFQITLLRLTQQLFCGDLHLRWCFVFHLQYHSNGDVLQNETVAKRRKQYVPLPLWAFSVVSPW